MSVSHPEVCAGRGAPELFPPTARRDHGQPDGDNGVDKAARPGAADLFPPTSC